MVQRKETECDFDCDEGDDDDFEEFASRRLRLIGKKTIHLIDRLELRVDLFLPIPQSESARRAAVESRVIGIARNF